MNKVYLIITTIALTFMTTNCNSNKNTEKDKLSAGIDISNFDTTADPGTDFYQYACGGWIKNNPLTDEYSRYGSFEKVEENNRKRIKTLIDDISSQHNETGTVTQKIGDLFNIAMDSAKLNDDGTKPLQPHLKAIASIKDKTELSTLIPELMLKGCPVFFDIMVDSDSKNSSMNILWLYQGGIAMGNRDYYIENDANTVKIRNAYKDHIAKMFKLCGFDAAQAGTNANDIMRIETRLAKAHYDNIKLRDPYANYHKMTVTELQKLVPAINWNQYFKILNIDINDLSVAQPDVMKEVGNIIKNEPLDALLAYCQWHLIDMAATFLNDDLYSQNFEFYGKTMSGTKEPKPRWKRAQNTVNSCLGEAVGQIYVAKYFPPEAKERMLTLVHNLQKAYAQRIQKLEWMSDSTKIKALEKLNAFYIKIGYPDKWKDYSKLEIKNDSYLSNIMRASAFAVNDALKNVNKPVDRDKWYMTPQTINAYYNPQTNEICFPAGILQYPFFDMNADDAFNYGAIGVVIGHEMTHGFDDQGRQFDKDGNLKNWWTDNDASEFNKRAKVMSDFFDSIQVAPDVHANGKFTLGETLADYGGLQISYQAYKNATAGKPLEDKNGYTADQRFFLAFAGVWAGNIREEEILRRTKTDPHALAKWRVNGELPHIDAWYEAFGITEKSPMYIVKENRVTIW